MSDGKIISDLKGREREALTPEDLMKKFKEDLDDDRILLSED
jgi:ABC-type uncharacterized transport system ATPase component